MGLWLLELKCAAWYDCSAYATTLDARGEALWIQMECLGWTQFCRGNYPEARRYYTEAKRLLDALDARPDTAARLNNCFGRLAAAEENYAEAIDLFWQGLRHAENEVTASFLESALGDVHSARRETDLALAHYGSVQTFRERANDDYRLCSVLCDIAELSVEQGDFDAGRAVFARSLKLAETAGRMDIAARCHYGLGELALATREPADAKLHLERALTAFEQLGRDRDLERVRALIPQANSAEPFRLDTARTPATRSESTVEVILVNAPRQAESSAFRCQDHRMPLGLMSISTFLKQRGVTCRIIDAEATGCGLSGIVDAVSRLDPHIVGINCHTLNRHVVYEIVRTLKRAKPDRLLVLGGAHAALAPDLTLRECPEVDAAVIGEGERTMYELSRRRGYWNLVPGICYLRDGKTKRTSPMPRIQDLDVIGFPDTDDLPISDYLNYEEPTLPGLWRRAYLSATRGCEYHCSYCTEHVFWKHGTTHRSAASVIAEIENYIRQFSVRRFYFYDDTFTDWRDLVKFCELATEIGIEWSCSTRIDAIKKELVRAMRDGGCREIAFGLESGSQLSLQRMNKGLTILEQNKNQTEDMLRDALGKRIRLCVEHGIIPRTHFMIGFNWESQRDIEDTVVLAVYLKEFGLRDANFFVVKTYPGTPLHSGVRRVQASRGLTDSQVYDVWSLYDWHSSANPKVRAKLQRFNDVPVISMHPNLDSLALRRLVKNAYETFFSSASVTDVASRLWTGVAWESAQELANVV